jgi:hypothetical protein
MLGSICLLVNNISGPAMLHLPSLVYDAGWLPTSLVIVSLFLASSAQAGLLTDCISRIPGNARFRRKLEFSDAFRYYLGPTWFAVSQVAFYASLLLQNAAALVAAAQSIDFLLADILVAFGAPGAPALLFGSSELAASADGNGTTTHGLSAPPSVLRFGWWSVSDCDSSGAGASPAPEDVGFDDDANGGGGGGNSVCVPFEGSSRLVLSVGYLLTTAILLPLGLHGLKETITAQLVSFGTLLLSCVVFMRAFFVFGVGDGSGGRPGLGMNNAPMIGSDFRAVVGIILYNFAFCVTLPTWLSEKASNVDAVQVVWISSGFSSTLYIVFGVIGAMAFGHSSDSVLTVLSSHHVDAFTRIVACLFGVFIIGLGVPVFCVLMTNNLRSGGGFARRKARFMGSVLPFLVSWLFYQGHATLNILMWAGLFANGLVAFVGPAILCWAAEATVENKRAEWIRGLLSAQMSPEFLEHRSELGLDRPSVRPGRPQRGGRYDSLGESINLLASRASPLPTSAAVVAAVGRRSIGSIGSGSDSDSDDSDSSSDSSDESSGDSARGSAASQAAALARSEEGPLLQAGSAAAVPDRAQEEAGAARRSWLQRYMDPKEHKQQHDMWHARLPFFLPSGRRAVRAESGIQPLPGFLANYKTETAIGLLVFFMLLIATTVVMDVATKSEPA